MVIDPMIIEKIRQEEERKRQEQGYQPEIQIDDPYEHEPRKPTPEKSDRGVTIIDTEGNETSIGENSRTRGTTELQM